MNKILIWVLTYEFFATLPSEVKQFINRMSEEFYTTSSTATIQEYANTYSQNGGTYDYFISQFASRYNKIVKKNERKPESDDLYHLLWLCYVIKKQVGVQLIQELDEEDRMVFRAFMVYLINRRY